MGLLGFNLFSTLLTYSMFYRYVVAEKASRSIIDRNRNRSLFDSDSHALFPDQKSTCRVVTRTVLPGPRPVESYSTFCIPIHCVESSPQRGLKLSAMINEIEEQYKMVLLGRDASFGVS